MKLRPSPRWKMAGFIALGTLLVLIPAIFGFLRMRIPFQASSDESFINNEVPGEVDSEISDEVYQSVLQKPDEDDESTKTNLPSRIKVLLDGTPIAIQNGEAVLVVDNYLVEIFVAPYPPVDFEVSVDLYITTISGEPVNDAQISIDYDMMFMNHGPFILTPTSLGNGHYIATYNFFMYGPWVIEAFIKLPEQESSFELPISIYVWPTN